MGQASNIVALRPVMPGANRDRVEVQQLINAATTSFVRGNISTKQFRARISEIVNRPRAEVAGLSKGVS